MVKQNVRQRNSWTVFSTAKQTAGAITLRCGVILFSAALVRRYNLSKKKAVKVLVRKTKQGTELGFMFLDKQDSTTRALCRVGTLGTVTKQIAMKPLFRFLKLDLKMYYGRFESTFVRRYGCPMFVINLRKPKSRSKPKSKPKKKKKAAPKKQAKPKAKPSMVTVGDLFNRKR